MNEIDYIANLLKEYIENKRQLADDDEIASLFRRYPFLIELVDELRTEEALKAALSAYGVRLSESNDRVEKDMWDRVLAGIDHHPIGGHPKRTPAYVRALWMYGTAAAMLLLAVGALLLRYDESDREATALAATEVFAPGGYKAILQVAAGHAIELSAEHEGVVIGDQLSYNDGTALLEGPVAQDAELILITPKGGQYEVVLSDGTRVWLNAASRLIYPKRFTGATRTVTLEGEAYFDVARNERVPFVVHTKSEKIQVLGTEFNVTAYNDESVSSVSLIEGSVEVTLPNKLSEVIKPGQQTVVQQSQLSVHEIDVNEISAWKSGEFMFNNENMESVLRKVARWYDLEIEVAPNLKETMIWGSISRLANFNKVLDIIKLTDPGIKFEVEGRRVRFMK